MVRLIVLTLAVFWCAAFTLGSGYVIMRMVQAIREKLYCGECGKFTEDLTDDDVCFSCDAMLARKATSHDA